MSTIMDHGATIGDTTDGVLLRDTHEEMAMKDARTLEPKVARGDKTAHQPASLQPGVCDPLVAGSSVPATTSESSDVLSNSPPISLHIITPPPDLQVFENIAFTPSQVRREYWLKGGDQRNRVYVAVPVLEI